ncbi:MULTISPECIES: chalcone isomerase family protein [Ferrimonas]|uniref:chalcone isomerase family protein n=1 Tax=Ferrimonas TaxID=44011 RepID=UPI0004161789|nr:MULTISPECIES: chalcone isomerase family protein [Ferrimonas]USD37077.1 chalcone isomerase family protein [Ferrimonas sp. SCSIO 43195]
MRKLLTAILPLSLCLSAPSWALTVADVNIDDSLNVQGIEMPHRGAGIRKKFFMKLYVSSLYNQDNLPAEELMKGKSAAAIQLDIISSMITSEKMTASMEEGFEQSAGDRLPQIQDKVDQFTAAFSEPVQEGDRFRIVSLPESGVELRKNGKSLVTIEGETFREVLLGIWLGDDPLDDDLKEAMLGE